MSRLNLDANDWEEKSIPTSGGNIQDVDFKSRTVTGYFSRFGNVDSDGDMIVPGAFKKTIKERGTDGSGLIVHLADHKFDTDNLLATPILMEKADGGFFESTISDTHKGIDILKQYRDGILKQHSFGFKTIREAKRSGYREIQETMIYEISSVVLGANDQTPFTGFKSMTKPQLINEYKLLTKAYRDGDYMDETFPILEARIKQMEREIVRKYLAETTQPESNPTVPEAKELDLFALSTALQTTSLKLQFI